MLTLTSLTSGSRAKLELDKVVKRARPGLVFLEFLVSSTGVVSFFFLPRRFLCSGAVGLGLGLGPGENISKDISIGLTGKSKWPPVPTFWSVATLDLKISACSRSMWAWKGDGCVLPAAILSMMEHNSGRKDNNGAAKSLISSATYCLASKAQLVHNHCT